MTRPRMLVIAMLVALAAASRLVPHPYNFTPLTAIALFGGVYFTNKYLAWGLPLAALLLSDMFLGFHSMMPVVYGCFAIMVLIGFSLRNHLSTLPILGCTLFGSLLFFIATNFAVWAFTDLYPKTISGLMACYTLAIPFFQYSLLGDLCYTTVLFGGFALLELHSPKLVKVAA